MHLKRLYKALAMVITVAMILPYTWVGADAGGAPEDNEIVVNSSDDDGSSQSGSSDDGSGQSGSSDDGSGQSGSDDGGGGSETPVETPIEIPIETPVVETPVPTETPTETKVPTPSESPTATETPAPTGTPSVSPEPSTTPAAAPTPEATSTPTKDEVKEKTTGYGSNAALVAAQQITMPSIVIDGFRFTTIEKDYAVANAETLQIYEEQSTDSRVVGTVKQNGLCFVIDETDSADWTYVESGVVRGFVRTESLITGEEADKIVKEKGEDKMVLAQASVDPLENEALTYTRTTVRETVVSKVYATADKEQVNIYEGKETSERVIGTLPQGGICYILADENEDWVFVEADNVRGFVKKDLLTTGESVEVQMEETAGWTDDQEKDLKEKSEALEKSKEELKDLKADKKQAKSELKAAKAELKEVEAAEKAAETEEVTPEVTEEITVTPTQAAEVTQEVTETPEAEQADSEAEDVADEENAAEDAETGEAKEDEVKTDDEKADEAIDQKAQLEAQIEDLTSKVEELTSKIEETRTAIEEQKTVAEEAESAKTTKLAEAENESPKVEQLVEPKDNKVCYYTLTSTREATVASSIGEAMITFASQFLGNPYVWGGTSLTNGTDCSGFTQGIYSAFGYSIPRTSGEQSLYGTQIPISEARTGDLIFYANNGTVYHVVMYIGDGQVIHASSSKTGIITSGIDTAHAVWATRMISDDDYEKVDEINAKAGTTLYGGGSYTNASSDDYGQLLGNFKLTAYCNCSICCGRWSGGPTASGTAPTEGRTVAMAGVPFGTKLIINGRIYTVEDRGTPYGHVDIYISDHDACNQFGVQYAQVYAAK